jgi:hypothetical protein
MPNPLGLRVLAEAGIDTARPQQQSSTPSSSIGCAHFDFVVTVCGAANMSRCSREGLQKRIGFDDPSAGDAPDDVKFSAFRSTLAALRRRIGDVHRAPRRCVRGPQLIDSARRLAEV